eukprot:CAMPEP_0180131612 /NCGR_PEP_ID=MMETSP0986-20121125/8518_1 /TAXON_ID=697907 /ORGANISM="non described non described, Strain CCMP2293" /LENGTH=452 /DNA_ID=CAMNT_0022071511 /DNA_START=245 /DNA_END=1603 /DNA_ORIENTATION=-
MGACGTDFGAGLPGGAAAGFGAGMPSARVSRVPMREVSTADLRSKTKTPLDRVPMRETSNVDMNAHTHEEYPMTRGEGSNPHKVLRASEDTNAEDVERKWLDEIGDVGEVVGVGSFSVVHAAQNLTSGQLLAIKMVKVPDDNEIFVKRLRREITILRGVDHPGIIKLLHVFEAPGKVNMVMERCVGGELFTLLEGMEFEEDGTRNWVPGDGSPAFPFTDDLVVDIIYQILSAVDYMHKRRIVHRDLKLENVLLDMPYKQSDSVHQVTVVDFGFSKVLMPDELLFSACGSPHYAAPEVISAKEKNEGYALEVDMWAVGVITYTLLCCQYPFDGENDAEVIRRVLAGDFCFPDHVTVSPEAQDFVRSLITVSREQRATAAECLEHPWIKTFTTDRLRDHKTIEQCRPAVVQPTVLRSASGGGPILGLPDEDSLSSVISPVGGDPVALELRPPLD